MCKEKIMGFKLDNVKNIQKATVVTSFDRYSQSSNPREYCSGGLYFSIDLARTPNGDIYLDIDHRSSNGYEYKVSNDLLFIWNENNSRWEKTCSVMLPSSDRKYSINFSDFRLRTCFDRQALSGDAYPAVIGAFFAFYDDLLKRSCKSR